MKEINQVKKNKSKKYVESEHNHNQCFNLFI